MEDMLRLFRHDAEHTHQVDGIGLGLVARDRVLSEDRRNREGVSAAAAAAAGALGRKGAPEHAVYGRRW
jgi:hypothetical protein